MAGSAAELAMTAAMQSVPVGTVSAGNTTTIDSLGEPADLDGTQSASVPQQASSRLVAVTPLQRRKRKKSKGEDTIELMQKMLKV